MSARSALRARTVFVAVLGALAVIAFAALAGARPGGGHSYSGGSGGGGYGGGGGSYGGGSYGGSGGGEAGGELLFALVRLLVYLIIDVPVVGVPIILAFVAALFWYSTHDSNAKDSGESWTTATPTVPTASRRAREQLDLIRTIDPGFSPVLFEDFVYSLYAAAHEARGKHQLETLAAYLTDNARAALADRAPNATDVKAVVIGAMKITAVSGLGPGDARVHVRVTFESNYTERSDGRDQSYYVVESWRFERDRAARSKPPERATVLACPNCGGALEQTIGGTCSFCKQNVGTGQFDWIVAGITLERLEQRGPQLTGTTPERGTELRSIVDPKSSTRWAEIQQRDPALQWSTLEARIQATFRALQVAWTSGQWEQARAYVSDHLHQSFAYWMAMSAAQSLRNVTENAGITKIEIVRVASDAWFDTVTVRFWATGLDYTLDAEGHVVGGSKTRERPYSEYWTFIRAAKRRGAARSDGKCPNCGAELKINMAGHCEYCRVKVTTGDFDWVLSRIEQDDSYTG